MCKILLIEDEAIEREALKIIISEYFQNAEIVGEASNSDDALKLIDSREFDLVFMDIKIPGLSGLELSKYIKDNYPQRSIVITTAHDEFEFAHAAIKIHVDDFLLKPIRKEKIKEAIEKYGKPSNSRNLNKYDHFINEISNDLIKNNYIDAIPRSQELIELIYSLNTSNIQQIWLKTIESSEKILVTAKTLNINNFASIERRLIALKRNREMYSNKYLATQKFLEFIRSIFKELLLEKKGFTGNINDILSYIEINIKKNVSLEDLSSYYNISPYYMSKLFKKETGINFIDYISKRKINLAKEMLEFTDMSIINIAIELGYNEPNYFSKVFKKSTGMSPTNFRKSSK